MEVVKLNTSFAYVKFGHIALALIKELRMSDGVRRQKLHVLFLKTYLKQ